MAKAWVLKNRRGGLIVRARGVVDGKQVSRDKTIPNADQELAEETARELNRRFMLGELGWLTEPRAPRRASKRRSAPGFTAYSDKWLEELAPFDPSPERYLVALTASRPRAVPALSSR